MKDIKDHVMDILRDHQNVKRNVNDILKNKYINKK